MLVVAAVLLVALGAGCGRDERLSVGPCNFAHTGRLYDYRTGSCAQPTARDFDPLYSSNHLNNMVLAGDSPVSVTLRFSEPVPADAFPELLGQVRADEVNLVGLQVPVEANGPISTSAELDAPLPDAEVLQRVEEVVLARWTSRTVAAPDELLRGVRARLDWAFTNDSYSVTTVSLLARPSHLLSFWSSHSDELTLAFDDADSAPPAPTPQQLPVPDEGQP